jgi:hypothetical protein
MKSLVSFLPPWALCAVIVLLRSDCRIGESSPTVCLIRWPMIVTAPHSRSSSWRYKGSAPAPKGLPGCPAAKLAFGANIPAVEHNSICARAAAAKGAYQHPDGNVLIPVRSRIHRDPIRRRQNLGARVSQCRPRQLGHRQTRLIAFRAASTFDARDRRDGRQVPAQPRPTSASLLIAPGRNPCLGK